MKSKNSSSSSSSSTPQEKKKKNKYRGVRLRKWGRWCAEIHNGITKKRVWLGSFDTAEEAAMAYDKASVRLRGDKAFTNFPQPLNVVPPPQPEIKQEQE